MKKNTAKEEVLANVEELEAYIQELEETLVYVRERKTVVEVPVQKGGRMEECLDVFKKYHPRHLSVHQIATELGINERNVSSLMTYLRQGKLNGKCYEICTDSKKLKFIANLYE